jgi:uncharacterized protein (TIGR03382 family)
VTTVAVLHAAASCVSDTVPCNDGAVTDATGMAVLVLLGVVLLGRQRR